MSERFSLAEQLEHGVQMLLGIFSAKGVLLLEFKPANLVGDLLTQQLDDLEEVANNKGGLMQTLADHFAKVCRVNSSVQLAA
jgi:mannose/fructose-specific phosphotransferase system component IIA